jgi:predicted enzyme related to lactoylglutathione lyase
MPSLAATPFPRGRVVWHELVSTDPVRAAGFYSTVVGWKVQNYEHDPTYRLWMTAGVPMGGLMRLREDARRGGTASHWMPYVAVPDVNATTRQAEALGARVLVAPLDIPPGRLATLVDPQGATFSLFRPAPGQPLGTDEPSLGDFSWHELAALDWKAAWSFYRDLFGWEHALSMEMSPGGTYWMFQRGGGSRMLGGIYTKAADRPGPAHWLCYAMVASADRAAQAVTRSGGRILTGPMDVPGGGRIAMCVDPQGAAFAVHAVATRPAKRAAPARRTAAKPTRRRKTVKVRKAKPKRAKRARAARRRSR